MTDAYASPPPQARSNFWPWLVGGCAIAFVALIAFICFLVFFVFTLIRNSTPYQDAVQRAQRDERVIAALGTPIQPRFFVSGSVNTQNGSGDANLNVPLRGPKGKASVHVVGTKQGRRWNYTKMTVTLPDRTKVNLLTSSEGSVSTDPPDG